MIATIRSALFAIAFYGGSVVHVTGTLLAARLGGPLGERGVFRIVLAWARYHRWCARYLLGIQTRYEGSFPPGPVIVASKHQSMFETVELLAELRDPAVVLKRELAELPGWGRAAQRFGVIPVDREGSGAALKAMLRAGRKAATDGRTILIFPEGTRVMPGETPPLRAGFAGLYKSLGLPVVPVALDSGRVWPRGRFAKRAGVVTIRIGETIPAGLPRDEAEARVHRAINLLEAEVPTPRPSPEMGEGVGRERE